MNTMKVVCIILLCCIGVFAFAYILTEVVGTAPSEESYAPMQCVSFEIVDDYGTDNAINHWASFYPDAKIDGFVATNTRIYIFYRLPKININD